jgi:hypothetical protein
LPGVGFSSQPQRSSASAGWTGAINTSPRIKPMLATRHSGRRRDLVFAIVARSSDFLAKYSRQVV